MLIKVDEFYESKKELLNKEVLNGATLFMILPVGADFKDEFDMEQDDFESLAAEFDLNIQIIPLKRDSCHLITYLKGLAEDYEVNGIVLGKSFHNDSDILKCIPYYKDISGSTSVSEARYMHSLKSVIPYSIRAYIDLLDDHIDRLDMIDALILSSAGSSEHRILQRALEERGGSVTVVHSKTSSGTINRRMRDSDLIIVLDDFFQNKISYPYISLGKGWCVSEIVDLTGRDSIDVDSFEFTNIEVSNDYNLLNPIYLLMNLMDCMNIQKEKKGS